MKKILILTLAVILTVGIASFALAGDGGGITGSVHDFKVSVSTLGGEICRICHSPHDHNVAAKNYLNGLLWNHAVTTATYTMYDSPTMNAADPTGPTGNSKLCLSCHDGTVAVDNFENHAGGSGGFGTAALPQYAKIPSFTTGANLDLRGTHPISIVYDAAADGYLMPVTAPFGWAAQISDVLEGGVLQCSSCHDVHNSPGEAEPDTPLLRLSDQGSAICLGCHVK